MDDACRYDEVHRYADMAYKKLEEAGGDYSKLKKEVAVFMRVYTADGVIGNGGLVFFFENDWINNPSYDEFVNAYREIGCDHAANCIAYAVSTFPGEQPENDMDMRWEYMEGNYDPDAHCVAGWDNSVCGDESVEVNLAKYANKHKDRFV